MPDGIDIKVTAAGAQKAEADLKKVARAEEGVGRAAGKAGRQTREGMGGMQRAMGGLQSQMQTLAAGMLGAGGIVAALRSVSAEMAKVEAQSRSSTEAMRATMALTMLKGERAEVAKAVWSAAALSGRPIEEVAPAHYTLRGGTAGMESGRRQGLMNQAALMAKTDPSASLDTLVSMFGTAGTMAPDMSPQQVGNLLSRTIEQAKTGPNEMAALMPEILAAGKTAGMDPATSSAMFAFATTRGPGGRVSGTAAKAAILGLLAPTPEVKKAMRAAGMPAGADAMGRLKWLTERKGQLPPETVAALGGREGISAVSALTTQPEAFKEEIAGMKEAVSKPGSRLVERIQAMHGELRGQRSLDQLKQAEVLIQKERTQPKVLANEAFRKTVDLILAQQGASPLARDVVGRMTKGRQYLGISDTPYEPLEAIRAALEAGYSAQDVAKYIGPVIGDRMAVPLGDMRGEQTPAEWARYQMGTSGAVPLQGGVTYNGGTHFHTANRVDPAGTPPDLGVQP